MHILGIGLSLLIFGILAIYSVSIYESFQITLRLQDSGIVSDPSNYFYFFRQLKNIAVGLIVAVIVYFIPLSFIERKKNIIFIGSLFFLLLVFTPLGQTFNGATGWLYIKGIGTVQPSEFFKIGFILFLSGWLIKKKNILGSFKGFISFLIITGIFFFIFLLIPDLGTILVLGLVVLIMYWYAGGKIHYVIGLFIIGIFFGLTVGMQFSYIKNRIDYFLNDTIDEKGRGVGWQIQQAMVSIGGGGFWGKGYGKGLQKFGYIPEAQSDFVFAAFSEEIGLVGNSVLLTLYFFLAYFFLINLKKIKSEYYKFLGVGLISLIIMQVFVNIGVNVKILPLTGLTLPFISFGGTALMTNLIEITILYKILKEGEIYNK